MAHPAVIPKAAGPGPAPAGAGASRAGLRLGSLLALLAALAALAWLIDALSADVEAYGYGLVDARRSRLDAGPGWVDPRWEEEIAWRLARLGSIGAEDRAALEALADEVASCSFVLSVGEPQVLWPDGLRLDVELREPVACVRAGRGFLALAADGTLLSGAWPAPPARGSGFLPVVVAPGGDSTDGRAVEDALAVATSMWSSLSPDDLARLGRIAIDARHARRATVEVPGTQLWLENGRAVYFGRPPNMDEPGELPAALKWASLARALRLLEPGEDHLDWQLADVRWDVPELEPRSEGGRDG